MAGEALGWERKGGRRRAHGRRGAGVGAQGREAAGTWQERRWGGSAREGGGGHMAGEALGWECKGGRRRAHGRRGAGVGVQGREAAGTWQERRWGGSAREGGGGHMAGEALGWECK